MPGQILFFTLAFATLSAMAWAAAKLFEQRENPLKDRLEELQSNARASAARTSRRTAGGGFLSSFLYGVSAIPGLEDYPRETEKELAQAGIRNDRALALYVVAHFGFLLLVFGGMLFLQRDNPVSSKFGGLVAAGIIGWMLPGFVLKRLVKRYRAKLQNALPDTVDLLGIVLGTGLALDQAMSRVSEEMHFIYPELASEFSTVVMQVKAGQDRSKAFSQLVRRTGIEDIKSLAAMIVQSERFGTSLSHALKVYAEALRTRRRLRAEATVGRAGIKMLFPVVLFILPALFVVTLVPGVLSVLRDLKGGIGPK
ncbi:MAG: type II secretion system F family protein [Bryobacteraceae bacterium]|nr:type II secretion system F family protein [Bryobacteraceae bacterium]